MRRFVLLAALALSFVAPSAVAAGGCPTDPGGLVDKDSYRIGELIQFFDSYTDFGDPGTTTIRFERPADGAVLDYTATNIADGTWFLDLQLDSNSFIGRWKALRPEMRPIPPPRLFMTAVRTASARSLEPFDSPPELIRPLRPM